MILHFQLMGFTSYHWVQEQLRSYFFFCWFTMRNFFITKVICRKCDLILLVQDSKWGQSYLLPLSKLLLILLNGSTRITGKSLEIPLLIHFLLQISPLTYLFSNRKYVPFSTLGQIYSGQIGRCCILLLLEGMVMFLKCFM